MGGLLTATFKHFDWVYHIHLLNRKNVHQRYNGEWIVFISETLPKQINFSFQGRNNQGPCQHIPHSNSAKNILQTIVSFSGFHIYYFVWFNLPVRLFQLSQTPAGQIDLLLLTFDAGTNALNHDRLQSDVTGSWQRSQKLDSNNDTTIIIIFFIIIIIIITPAPNPREGVLQYIKTEKKEIIIDLFKLYVKNQHEIYCLWISWSFEDRQYLLYAQSIWNKNHAFLFQMTGTLSHKPIKTYITKWGWVQ